MDRVPCRKARPRERVASPQELQKDRRRWLEATAPKTDESDLCKTLKRFAQWRKCSTCGSFVLYVDENLQTDTACVCGRCKAKGEPISLRWSLPARVLLHLHSMFLAANDNHEGTTVQDAS